MTDYTEQNNLQIITDDCDHFCLSSPRELSITRDVAERLVFAQMSEISYDNVAEYYARLSTVAYAYKQNLMQGTIFDDEGNELYKRKFKAIDFISRIGVKTNLKKDTLRNFLTRAADRLLELSERSIINYEYSYDDLLKYYQTQFDYFISICDVNQIGRVDETISAPGLIRALDLALVSAEHEYQLNMQNYMERKQSMKDKDGNEIPLTPKDQSYFIALRDSINKAQRNIEPGSDYQKGAIAAFNDVLDMIERIIK